MCPLDELQRARLARLRAQIAFALQARQRRAAAAARRRQTARGARSRAGARDLPRGARSGDVRRAPRRRLGVRRRPRRPAPRRAAPQPPRSIDLVLDGLATRFTEGTGRGRAAAAARAARRSATRRSTATRRSCAGCCCARSCQSMTVFELWDDDAFERARHPRGAAGARDRRAHDAAGRARLPVRRARLRRGVRGGLGADRRRRTRSPPRPATPALMYARLLLGAWRGVEAEAHGAASTPALRERDRAGRGTRAGAWPATPPPCSTTAWAATRRPPTAPSAAASDDD